MRINSVRNKLREGGVVYGIMAAEFFTPGFCQIAGNAGAEFVIFDMEHGAVGIDTLNAQMAFARRAGIEPLVRVPGHPVSSRRAGARCRRHGHYGTDGRDSGPGRKSRAMVPLPPGRNPRPRLRRRS